MCSTSSPLARFVTSAHGYLLGAALLAVGASTATACSSPAAPTPARSGLEGDAGADAGAPAPSCGSELATSALPCGTLEWSRSAVESRPRNHHSTEIWRAPSGAAWLYVLGGFDGMSTTYANVDRAMLAEDGSLGAFASMTALPRALGGHVSAIVSNDGGAGGGASWMVVAGGMAGSATLDGSYVAPLNDDGSLGGWKAGPKLPHARMHAGAFVFGSFVYVLGGFENESVWDDVLRASVQPNGELSTFENVGKLPGPRSHFAVTRVGRSVYLTGGLAKPAFDNPPALTEVRRARLADDGSLTDFEALAPLPFAYATHSSFAYGGWLYVVGGVGEEAQEKRVLRAEILPDQTLGPWEAAAPLPLARGHVHQTPVYGDHVYSVGGAIDFELTSTKEIVIGSFRQP